MYRIALEELIKWKSSTSRKPLVIKGVRQCGKTYLLNEFGRSHYADVAYYNFEANEALCGLFDQDLDTERIILELGIFRNKVIRPEETLIIFDEIQFCPKALTSLKYFAETAPNYPIACAGSLLGIALSGPGSFPVGKVDFLSLYPLSFEEFLMANQEMMLVRYLHQIHMASSISDAIKIKLIDYLRNYYLTGGMPEVVATWIRTKDWEEVDRIQQSILDGYELDFARHAPSKDFPKLTAIWKSIPGQLARDNSKFIFSRVKKGWRAKDLEGALGWLEAAGLVYKVCKVEQAFTPLSSYADQLYFKLYMADIGLLRRMAGLSAKSIFDPDHGYREFKGALAENYVLNQLMAQGLNPPYFWRSGNKAEVDYIVQLDGLVIPIEVKAERNVQAKSLAEYRKTFEPEIAVRTSMRALSDGEVAGIPLYLISMFSQLIRRKREGQTE